MDKQNDKQTTQTVENGPWQLQALTEALGELNISVNDSLSIGRGQDNDIVLGSKQISRNHALLSVLNGKLYLKDLDSSNGTFINDERVEANLSKQLSHHDKVSFASFSFAVIAPQAAQLTESTPVADTAIEPEHTELATPLQPATEETAQTATHHPATSEDKTDKAAEQVEKAPLESILPPEVQTTQPATEPQPETIQQPVQPLQANAEPIDSEHTEDNSSATESKPATHAVMATADKQLTKVLKNGAEKSVDTQTNANVEANVEAKPEARVKPVEVQAETNPSAASQTTDPQPTSIEKTAAAHSELQAKPAEEPQSKQPTMSNNDPHDKTTTTELQREADPEVLKAKQAATSQFSGTANLGGSKDLGTQGNNAMDQALNNPATHPSMQKKSSGSWFIWLFIGLIVLGIALWMFNMGGV